MHRINNAVLTHSKYCNNTIHGFLTAKGETTMSKSIGKALGAGSNIPLDASVERDILNYLNQHNMPNDLQPQTENNVLVNALRAQAPEVFAKAELNQKIEQLREQANYNPAVQQQLSSALIEALKKFGEATKAASVGYTTGTSLGNFDEAMGTLATPFGVDYKGARDSVRQLQNNLSQQHPYVYKGMEMIGAATTPLQLFKGASRGVQAANAVADTIYASAGYAENWNDFGLGLISNGIANGIGYKAKYSPGGRALGNIGRKAFTQGINQGLNYFTDNLKNVFYDEHK